MYNDNDNQARYYRDELEPFIENLVDKYSKRLNESYSIRFRDLSADDVDVFVEKLIKHSSLAVLSEGLDFLYSEEAEGVNALLVEFQKCLASKGLSSAASVAFKMKQLAFKHYRDEMEELLEKYGVVKFQDEQHDLGLHLEIDRDHGDAQWVQY